VIAELEEKLSTEPDYITLSGSGEPTLFSRMGELIERIRIMSNVPVAVLTNGSLLWDRQVRVELQQANLVVPSLDAGSSRMFQEVNRPHSSISIERLLEGLRLLRAEFKGEYWLEVFILGEKTDAPAELDRIAAEVRRIRPDRVQLNTVTRPPAEENAKEVSKEALETIAGRFGPSAEVIADFRKVHDEEAFTATRDTVLQLLERRPCSIGDVAEGLGIHRNEAVKYIEELLSRNMIQKDKRMGKVYYRVY
jgi:wyosine [tRNA(Phe)-imidazoG37] synthetase (radical SAM superfamily)